jgi:hypothetical protein
MGVVDLGGETVKVGRKDEEEGFEEWVLDDGG